MKLVDIGANLTHTSFEKDLPEVLQRAKDIGIEHIVVTGSDREESHGAYDMAKSHPGFLFSTAGVHPHGASEWDEEVAGEICELAKKPEVVALGECGLDYNRDFSPRPKQRECFEAQLQLANEFDLPLFLHQRDAHDDFFAMLKSYRSSFRHAVVHCFTGIDSELEDYLSLDLHVGITGWICDERRGYHLKDIVSTIPLNRLMIESDAPYLLPRTLRPKPKKRRNEPSYLTETLQAVAEAYGLSPEEIAKATTKTAKAFFEL